METVPAISNVSERSGHASSLRRAASPSIFITTALHRFSRSRYGFVFVTRRRPSAEDAAPEREDGGKRHLIGGEGILMVQNIAETNYRDDSCVHKERFSRSHRRFLR